jgi:hypothetical protein
MNFTNILSSDPSALFSANTMHNRSNALVSDLLTEIDASLHILTSGKADEDCQETIMTNIDYDNEAFFDTFPDWQVVKNPIGSGACGVVYAAEHPETKQILFAIKKSSINSDQSPVCFSQVLYLTCLSRCNTTPLSMSSNL